MTGGLGKARGNLAYQRQRIFFVVDLPLMNALNQAAREFDDCPIKRRIVNRMWCADVQRRITEAGIDVLDCFAFDKHRQRYPCDGNLAPICHCDLLMQSAPRVDARK
jgi:hypothetical protein